jgi:hypothetical protein
LYTATYGISATPSSYLLYHMHVNAVDSIMHSWLCGLNVHLLTRRITLHRNCEGI